MRKPGIVSNTAGYPEMDAFVPQHQSPIYNAQKSCQLCPANESFDGTTSKSLHGAYFNKNSPTSRCSGNMMSKSGIASSTRNARSLNYCQQESTRGYSEIAMKTSDPDSGLCASNLYRAVAASACHRGQQEQIIHGQEKTRQYTRNSYVGSEYCISEVKLNAANLHAHSKQYNSRRRTLSSYAHVAEHARNDSGWQVATDPKTKRCYYYHTLTRKTTWKKPRELVEKEKREKVQFFATMEYNIREKYHTGHWLRRDNSTGSDTDAISTPETYGSGKHDDFISRDSLPESYNYKQYSPPKGSDYDCSTTDLSVVTSQPSLFRTISSYETTDLTKRDSSCETSPTSTYTSSPIAERIRLVVECTNDDYFHKHAIKTRNKSTSTVSSDCVQSSSPTGRSRSNSTGTIYVRMGTMNTPDQDTTIVCVATVVLVHLMEARAAPILNSSKFDIFIRPKDFQLQLQASYEQEPHASIPSVQEIARFIQRIYSRAQMESECIIMTLIYVERLLKSTSGFLQLQTSNWRCILFCSMIMASKVWDDLSMCNADFSKIWPELSLQEINELELTYLQAVEYNVRVSAVSYAKYYFHLRSMCASMGWLSAFEENIPLNLDGARKMQVLSEEYQERSKFIPVPRRRSRTLANTHSVQISDLEKDPANVPLFDEKRSKVGASLEQLVQMEVRGAGGLSLYSMHRMASCQGV